jgi:CheY-like chemotaxis protein
MAAAAAAAPDVASVLLVEDDDDTREVTARLLQAAGCLVRATPSVGEALLLLEEWLPTHVLLDLMLPDAGGIVVLRAVRRRNLPVRIAVVTAAGPESPAVADAQRWNPDAIFYKPILFTDVESWLEEA